MVEFDPITLDLKKIADSGQTFRMTEDSIIAGSRFASFKDNTILCPSCDDSFWRWFFDMDTDYEAYISSIDPKDDYLLRAADY